MSDLLTKPPFLGRGRFMLILCSTNPSLVCLINVLLSLHQYKCTLLQIRVYLCISWIFWVIRSLTEMTNLAKDCVQGSANLHVPPINVRWYTQLHGTTKFVDFRLVLELDRVFMSPIIPMCTSVNLPLCIKGNQLEQMIIWKIWGKFPKRGKYGN